MLHLLNMDVRLQQRINRAKQLLKTARHGAMATVNADGSPHNTPFFMLLDDKLKYVYWSSAPESLHCQNITRTGQLFLVVYDATESGGLYIKAKNGHILEGEELNIALQVHNYRRAQEHKATLTLAYYAGLSPQRMYGAELTDFWINIDDRDKDGLITQDRRESIQREDLLK
jgi:hypothetical protein